MANGVIDHPPANDPARELTFIEQFIDRHYMKQPRAVRTTTFLVFVGLFVYAFVKLIGGSVVFSGEIFESDGPQRWTVARNYDVRAGGGERVVGTNSKGEYHVIVGNMEALQLLARGTLSVEVTDKDGHLRGERDVAINRWTQRLSRYPLDAEGPRIIGAATPIGDRLFPVVYASEPAGNRLFVRQLMIKEGANSLALRCVGGCTGGEQALRASRGDGDAGALPVFPGKGIFYDFDYYFEIPKTAGSVSIRATSDAKGLFGRDEVFDLGAPRGRLPRLGEELRVTGNQGTTMTILLMSPDDMVVFPKSDVVAKLPALKTRLRQKGLGYVEEVAPLGGSSETNALFVGSAVSVDSIQATLAILQELGIRLKTVRKRELKSGNQHQLQLGSVATLKTAAALPSSVMTQLLSAPNDDQFWAINQTPQLKPPVARASLRPRR